MPAPLASLRALMAELIDYAGLFPPAQLAMGPAVRNYDEYRRGADAWALGRFIVPSARLEEFGGAAAQFLPEGADTEPWLVSMLGGVEPAHDAELIFNFNERHAGPTSGRAVIDAMEVKAATPAVAERLVRSVPDHVRVFVEIPVSDDPAPLLDVIGGLGASAKIRTGGVTGEAFPSTASVARFVHRAVERRVPFKATAGLHHPVRGPFPLTYDPDSPVGTMFGFLNFFTAAALAAQGADQRTLEAVLDDAGSRHFRFSADALTWQDTSVSTADLATMRHASALAYGSCSFTEPMHDLRSLGLL